MSKQIINFTLPRITAVAGRKTSPADPGHEHHTQIDGAGTGDADFHFPEPDVLAKRALRRLARAERAAKKRLRKAGKTPVAGAPTTPGKITATPTNPQPAPEPSSEPASDTSGKDAGKTFFEGLIVPTPAKVVPAGQTRETYLDGQDLLKAADGLQTLMMNRQFDGFVEQRFGDMVSVAAWGVKYMPTKKLTAVKSLATQLDRLIASYQKTLPKLTADLAKRNPKAPLVAVMNKAVELLDQELARIIYVLEIYIESIKQVRDGRFTAALDATEVFFEDAFTLYTTGDLHCGNSAAAQLPTSTYKVGDVFMPRVTSSGLATIPGARGPIGANALQLPFEMLDCLMLVLPLLGHEARHNVYHDITGLEQELLDVVEEAIRDAHTAGLIKFEKEDMQLGEQTVKTIDLVVKLFCDWLSEIDADVVGGVLFSGTSFGGNMVMSFPAMMVRDGRVSDKVKLIRTESRFDLVQQKDGNVALVFEEHPVDYIRIYIVAAALEEVGFPAEATKLRQLADFAVGDELPKEIVYKEASGQSDLVVKFATADLLAVAATLVKAIIRKPLKAQLGKSCGDLVMWDKKRQGKVDTLAGLLAVGKSDLPTDMGSIYATYVGAAASQAYLDLIRKGVVDSVTAAKTVNEAALKMIGGLRALSSNQCPVPAPVAPAAEPAPTK
ncbi:MAG: hypothetical protein KGS72_20275 [Cyanobacteria bacterium REEB67]|nr:hypothetical protein [Cyanobacteria bacterium REEB67]